MANDISKTVEPEVKTAYIFREDGDTMTSDWVVIGTRNGGIDAYPSPFDIIHERTRF